MLYIPKSLFDTALSFVAGNVDCVDSLVGFPELVGIKILTKFIECKENIQLPIPKLVNVVKVFVEAYNELFIFSINLSESLIVLNEYFECYKELFPCVTELCLCSCYLGNNHEIFEQISNFNCLKKLCLRKNCLKDEAIRKFTLPIRMFNKGPIYLQHMDLSDNELTDAIAPWICAFKNLQYLNLSGAKFSVKGINYLEQKCYLKLSDKSADIHPVSDVGWAKPLIAMWKENCLTRRLEREIGKQHKYVNKRRQEAAKEISICSFHETMSTPSLIFERIPTIANVNQSSRKAPKKQLFASKEAMENDIFAQYL